MIHRGKGLEASYLTFPLAPLPNLMGVPARSGGTAAMRK
jgi:hypothetical protein